MPRTAAAQERAETGLAGALGVARGLPGGASGGLAEAARSAFVDGFALAGTVSAALAVIVGVGAWKLLPHGDEPVAVDDAGPAQRDVGQLRPLPVAASSHTADTRAPTSCRSKLSA